MIVNLFKYFWLFNLKLNHFYFINFRTASFVVASSIYGQLLVVICLAFFIAELCTPNIPLFYFEVSFNFNFWKLFLFFLNFFFCFGNFELAFGKLFTINYWLRASTYIFTLSASFFFFMFMFTCFVDKTKLTKIVCISSLAIKFYKTWKIEMKKIIFNKN